MIIISAIQELEDAQLESALKDKDKKSKGDAKHPVKTAPYWFEDGMALILN